MSHQNTALWTMSLFAFWVLLSGKLDVPHLGMGAACALAVAMAARALLSQPPAIGPGTQAPITMGLVVRLIAFSAWLVKEIVVGSLQVAWVVLHPRLPIDPRLVRLRCDQPHPLARMTLASSITLTPGTVTLDAAGNELLVHALTDVSAAGLGSDEEPGALIRRARHVFVPAEGAPR